MPTVVSVMDRGSWNARTDNIVCVTPNRRRLEWIPRDLWSDIVGDRINAAFARGCHRLLMDALGEHGLAVGASICFRRAAVERALESLSVSVPVARPLDFWYPRDATASLEDGRRLVSFRPPRERLAGERIHQWLGARSPAGGAVRGLPDLARIERQKVFIRRLLEERFAFSKLLEDSALVSFHNHDDALADLACIEPTWRFRTYDAVRLATVDGKIVLVPPRVQAIHHLTRLVRRVARV